MIVNSDAHYKTSLGSYAVSLKMLEDIEFPKKLILNANLDRFRAYLKEKRGIELPF